MQQQTTVKSVYSAQIRTVVCSNLSIVGSHEFSSQARLSFLCPVALQRQEQNRPPATVFWHLSAASSNGLLRPVGRQYTSNRKKRRNIIISVLLLAWTSWTFLLLWAGGRVACLLRCRSRALESLRDAHHDLLHDVPAIVQRAVDEYQQVKRAWL